MSVEIISGSTEQISIRFAQGGVGITGATIKVKIQRKDGLWFDWADSTFKALGSVGTLQQTLTAVTGDTSRYAYAWNTSTITNAVASDTYTYSISQTAPTSRPELYAGEIRTVIATLIQAIPTTAAPTASTVAAAVWAALESSVSGTMGAALSLIRRRTTNRRKLNATTGVTSFYADDGSTVEKSVSVTDKAGAPFVPATGEAAESTAES